MIVFDLACGAQGHVFEAWFGSTEDYEGQRTRGLVACPLCGDTAVSKAVMAPNVAPKGNARRGPALPVARPDNAPPAPEAIKAMLSALAEAQARVLATSDDMGDRFADEARAIHFGESEKRAIHGVATPVEVKGLVEDGVEIAPLPFSTRAPGRIH